MRCCFRLSLGNALLRVTSIIYSLMLCASNNPVRVIRAQPLDFRLRENDVKATFLWYCLKIFKNA